MSKQKPIIISYEKDGVKKEYKLEYNRKAVADIEAMGFNVSEVTSKMATMLPLMFRGAFLKNHPSTKREEIEEIYGNIGNKSELVAELSSRITECYQSLIEDNEATDEGNASWKIAD